ncbi:putative transporter [Pseudogemmobacter blasticus]|uniref:Putative transporter n=1 Tax=Fuscovulum blasticum DSM 2131 TaxID=1188250 RepID=A0A2T4JBJ8_FUSBL|nr:putative transporter [Fuscovulum blasticum]PTE15269.1 putative transporter [Fuscovulum blasticum DSM 2131]
MSAIGLSILLLCAAAVLGLMIGAIRIRGVGLGIGGVLFGGILVGHVVTLQGWQVEEGALHFIKEFGLILFVYSIGNQVGPSFVSSLRRSGLRLNLLAAAIVALGALTTLALHYGLGVAPEVLLGVYSGAVTNTPSLAAGQQTLAELGLPPQATGVLTLGYAMAYPLGIVGILLTMWIIRIAFGIRLDAEAEAHAKAEGGPAAPMATNVAVGNPGIDGLTCAELAGLLGEEVICSRLKSGGELKVPEPGVRLAMGDVLHLVGSDAGALHRATLIVGREVAESLSTKGTGFRSERVVVTSDEAVGSRIGDLLVQAQGHVVISRLHRAGVELVARPGSVLHFGDILNIVGPREEIERLGKLLGNVPSRLNQVQMLPIFIGIGLGVLLGAIPVAIPGMPVPMRLGLAGGPLIAAIVLARLGSLGRLHWFMPPSANLALRELGIVLFLAVVGLDSGGEFLATLTNGDGLAWMGYGAVITLLPILTVGIFARIVLRLNYLSLCGLLSGSMTDPPALAFANSVRPDSDAPAMAYAAVYPLVMFLRILSPQLMAIVLVLGGF